MAIHYPIEELVCEANVLCDLDKSPPPMKFNDDFGVRPIEGLQVSKGFDADLGFWNNKSGPMLS